MHAFHVFRMLGQDGKVAIYRKQKENMNHKDESKLQKLIFKASRTTKHALKPLKTAQAA